LDCVNEAYRIAILEADLPVDGSTQIAKRVESVLQSDYGRKELDKGLVMGEILKKFSKWHKASDAPEIAIKRAEILFKAINEFFA
jgi:hypothetical protein